MDLFVVCQPWRNWPGLTTPVQPDAILLAYAREGVTANTPHPLRVYHMVIFNSFNMTLWAANYNASIAAFRNVHELARDIRVTTISAAKAHCQLAIAAAPPQA